MQRETRPTILIVALGLVVSVTLALLFYQPEERDETGTIDTATALLANHYGETVGRVTFQQGENGVLVKAVAHGLSPGGHALTIHSVGSCTPNLGSAGGHFSSTGQTHGLLNAGDGSPAHSGDLPNIYASDNGTARADFFTNTIAIVADHEHSVFDEDGSAIIIHEKPDPYMGEENPDTGFRVACGVIEMDKPEVTQM